jgi:pimeloyl-ACP methyl ester carboxylesterase
MDGTGAARESFFVDQPASPGLRLHVRARRPARGRARGVTLFVHGATIASGLFDIARPGASWLDDRARRGHAAYALDVRGYGRSTGLAEMEAPATVHAPVARATDAAADIAAVVEAVCARENVERVDLVGGSWGSITSALYAIARPDRVAKLALTAPIFAALNRPWLDLIGDPTKLPAWRAVDVAGTRARWDAEILAAGAVPEAWRDEDTFEALMADSLTADPTANLRDPPSFRAPNGTLLDLYEAFSGRPLYAPARILCPTLLVRGLADLTSTGADARALLARLGSARKSLIEIGGGAHFLCAERRAPELFEAVARFLDASYPA